MPTKVSDHGIGSRDDIPNGTAVSTLCVMPPSLESVFHCSEPVGARASAVRAWERGIEAMPSALERLLYLAGLREGESRRYHHPMLDPELGAERAHEVMEAAHRKAFLEWICTDVASQKACVTAVLDGISTIRKNALLVWGQIQWHQRLFPDNATERERLLFLTDMEVVLQLLECEQSTRIGSAAFVSRISPAYTHPAR